MAVQFGSEILDTLLAPGISTFNTANVPALSEKFPQAEHWISNLFLNRLFGARYNRTWHQTAVTFIHRTQVSMREYELARSTTLRCTAVFSSGRPDSSSYFRAVSHLETVLLNIQISLDLFLKVISPGALETDDAVRIRQAANRIKHFAEDVRSAGDAADLTLPLWLGKDGLVTRAASVTYAELAENLVEMGRAADILQNPSAPAPSP
ncbi:MAG TPA: hypothetical protein VIO94_07090 [Phenylobacterium sp.]